MNRTNGFSVTACSSALFQKDMGKLAYAVDELLCFAGETASSEEGGML
jgi:hypothetical protein